MTDTGFFKQAVIVLVALQLVTVVLLGLLVLRPQASGPDGSGSITSGDVQQLDSDLQKSISDSCKAITGENPFVSPNLANIGAPTCP